jgi:hypothetical protein
MQTRLPLLAALTLALPAVAQKECMSTHDDGTINTRTITGGQPQAFRLTAPRTMKIVAAQTHTGLVAGTGAFSILDHDPVANEPTTNLSGRGTFPQRKLIGWQGTVLPNAVTVQTGQVFWLLWEAPANSRTPWSTSTSGTIYYKWWDASQQVWRGQSSGQGYGPKPVKLRLYCEFPSGPTVSVGSGKAGSGGFVPALDLAGWAVHGNALEFVLQRGMINAQAILLAGLPTTLPVPGIGTIHVQPLADIVVTTSTGRGAGDGEATVEIRVPDVPALAGVTLGFQYWVVDSGASAGLAHTDGLVVTIN